MPDMRTTLLAETTPAFAMGTDYSQTVDRGTGILYNTGKDREIVRAAGVAVGADVPVRSSNESQGNRVVWNEADETITIRTPTSGSVTLKKDIDFYIGADGKAYYINNPLNAVIAYNLDSGNRVELVAGTAPGSSRIIITEMRPR